MRYIADHDFHIHSTVSFVAKTKIKHPKEFCNMPKTTIIKVFA